MKIAILGNGKMGKRIITLAKRKGHSIVCIANSKQEMESINLNIADVAIDFSTPDSAFNNISHAINSGTPIISGTTGWLKKREEIEELCKEKKGAFLHTSNFSLGMNIFFELNKKLARLMQKKDYFSTIHEIHHTEKIDNPSGTAKNLAKQIDCILKTNSPITSERIGDEIGTHTVTYHSSFDELEIKHTTKERDGFALGAIIAAEWILKKEGIFNMQDVLTQ